MLDWAVSRMWGLLWGVMLVVVVRVVMTVGGGLLGLGGQECVERGCSEDVAV